MATQTTIILTDSLDERIQNGVETVTFFDPTTGQKREIELGEQNRKHFANHLEKLAKYIDASVVVEVPEPAKKPSASAAKGEGGKIREWAALNGYIVGDRGRIKAEIIDAYNAAQTVAIVETVPDMGDVIDEVDSRQDEAEQSMDDFDATRVDSEDVPAVESNQTEDEAPITAEAFMDLINESASESPAKDASPIPF